MFNEELLREKVQNVSKVSQKKTPSPLNQFIFVPADRIFCSFAFKFPKKDAKGRGKIRNCVF